MINCKNCNHEFEGEFCPSCGQKHIEKFTWKHISSLFLQSIEMERGLLLNIKDLTIRPTQTINGYLIGKTKNYLNPIAYFLIILALITFIISISDNLVYRGFAASSFISSDENIYLRNIFFMFFLGFGINVSLFIFNKYTFIENAIISLFITSHTYLIHSLLSIIPYDTFYIISLVLPTLYAINIIYKILGHKILGSIWRLLLTLIITSFFALSGILLLSVAQPYLEQEKVSDLVMGFNQKENSLSKIKDGTVKLRLLMNDTEMTDFESTTMKFLKQIDNGKDGMIKATGGMSETGNFISTRDKSNTFRFIQNIEDSLLYVQQEWLNELDDHGCELVEESELIKIENFQNIMMIEALIEFSRVEHNILLTEQQCYLKHLGDTVNP